MNRDRLWTVIKWHDKSETEHEVEQRHDKIKEWNQKKRIARSNVWQLSCFDYVTLRQLSRLLLKIVKNAIFLIRCRNRNTKIQTTTINVTWQINIFEKDSENSPDIKCETNTRHQKSKNCVNACRKMWDKWMKIDWRLSKIDDLRLLKKNKQQMLKCQKRCWGVFSSDLFVEKCAETIKLFWIRLKNAYNFRFAQIFKRFGFSVSKSTYIFRVYIEDTMTLINLNFIQFYQLLVKVDLIDKRSSMTSINDVFVVCEKKYILTISKFNNGWNEQIDNNDLIEIFDLIDSSSKNFIDLFYKQTSNLKDIELCVLRNFYRFWLCWIFNNNFKSFEQTRSQ